MPTVEFEGNTFNVDEDGFIDDFNNWNESWVQHVKQTEGIEELTDEHHKIIEVLQDYYKKNGIAPMVRILSKDNNTGFIKRRTVEGIENKSSRRVYYEFFLFLKQEFLQ